MSDDRNASSDQQQDDILLAELRAMAGTHDPVPPEAVAAARSALAWRTMDAELAELVADSSVDREDLALVRGTGAPTLLTFESPGLTVEVEVESSRGSHRILGQLVPPGPGTVVVRHASGTTSVDADDVGRFRADDVPSGPVSLRCSAGATVVETDWFLV